MKKINVRLLADRVLVKVSEQEEITTSGGIIIPESVSKEAALKGIVLNISTRIHECTVEEDKVHRGEIVLFSKYAGTDLRYDGDDYKILRITDIFGALKK